MPKPILAIDAGTTSVRAMVVDENGHVRGRHKAGYEVYYPVPGRVEQDPDELWSAVEGVVGKALNDATLVPSDLGAIGITGQRSCCMIWDRGTGLPVGPLIGWQDLRGVQRASELVSLGFPVQAQAAAAKLEAALDVIPQGRARAERGELAWGNVDSYLVARLTSGAVHATDPSNACATSYFDYEDGSWATGLIEAQGLSLDFFPTIHDTFGVVGETDAGRFGATVPIAAIIGDQQSAAIAQGCLEPGTGKITLGTSGTCNVCTGNRVLTAPGLYPLVLQRRFGETHYCLEGMAITTGAVFDWLASGLGLIASAADSESVAGSVSDANGVSFLPALQGLGTPYFDPRRAAAFGGLTRGSSSAHLVRAAMEGVVFRLRQVIEAAYDRPEFPQPSSIRVDGGAAANDLLLQLLADMAGIPVERATPLEATAYGTAILAGQGIDQWTASDADAFRNVGSAFEPTVSEGAREARFETWKRGVGLTD